MSHAYVRQQFRAAVQLVLPPLGFQWFESINLATRTQNLPRRWYSMEFLGADDQPITLGVPQLNRETGTCSVQIYTEQQITDEAGTDAAETLREAFALWHDVSGHLRITECEPATDVDGGDFRGSFYGLAVGLRYSFDHFVTYSPILEVPP